MSDNLYNLLVQNMPFPLWVMNEEKRFVFANKAYTERYNIHLKDIVGKKIEEIVDIGIGNRYEEKIEEAIALGGMSKFLECFKGKLSEYHIMLLLNDNKEIEGFAGIGINVQEMKDEQIELKNQKNILRTIIDTLPYYIFYKNKESQYVGYNKKWDDYYKARGIDNVIGKNDLQLEGESNLDIERAKAFMQKDKEVMESRKEQSIETVIENPDGSLAMEECIKVPVINENNEVWGIVGIARDITKRKNIEERLRYLSYTDHLTGLNNRTSFEEAVISLNKEEHLPIGIIMGDVNGLKIVNDTLGHLEGDELLKAIAKVLKEVSGTDSSIFRWGGDEFVILQPRCNEEGCKDIIKKIRKRCETDNSHLINLSISLGDSTKKTIKEDIYVALKEAEEKVYNQKLINQKSNRSGFIHTMQKKLVRNNIEMEEHIERLLHYGTKIAESIGLKAPEMEELMLVIEFHDIGKVGVDEKILLKSGTLSDEEFELVKAHVDKGFRILQTSNELFHVARGVLMHHERWDGTGYPLRLKGEEISLSARIVNIIDSYDSMTNDKVYKKAMSSKEAIEEIKRCSGKQFDPILANVFVAILEEENALEKENRPYTT